MELARGSSPGGSLPRRRCLSGALCERLEQRYRRLFQLTSAVIVKNQTMRSV